VRVDHEAVKFLPPFLRARDAHVDVLTRHSPAGHTPHIDRIGISYMYVGAWKPAKDGSAGHEFHVGPHLMVVGPNQDEFRAFNRDATNGMPYVTHLPNRTELFLVMPLRQWNE
jgi:hypothetical protein